MCNVAIGFQSSVSGFLFPTLLATSQPSTTRIGAGSPGAGEVAEDDTAGVRVHQYVLRLRVHRVGVWEGGGRQRGGGRRVVVMVVGRGRRHGHQQQPALRPRRRAQHVGGGRAAAPGAVGRERDSRGVALGAGHQHRVEGSGKTG
ncbi:Protein of unknown function [Gryllus bimaculatus]|nr:Protein of unknown function [Gryllus bimaculatus]